MYPIDGVCQTLHNGCKTAIASPSSSWSETSTTYQWTCPGQYGGKDTKCTENKIIVDGQCGPVPSSPTHYVCNKGSMVNNFYNPFSYTYTWNCNGANGGTNASCTEVAVPPPKDGKCTVDPKTNMPIHYSCDYGNSIGGYDAGASWNWTCAGAFGGTNQSCVEMKPQNGVCGPMPADPQHYACQVGTSVSNVESTSQWTWTCNGLYGGLPANCAENKLPTITWSPAVGPTIPYNTKVSYAYSTTNAVSCDYDETDASGNVINNIWKNGPTASPWLVPQGPYQRDVYRRLTCRNASGKTTVSNYHIIVQQNNANCISVTAPSYLLPGQTFNGQGRMYNSGTNGWTTGYANYVLTSTNGLWGTNAMMSLTNPTVAGGSEGRFSGSLSAPTTEGHYDFSWQMRPIFGGLSWPVFGQVCKMPNQVIVQKATLALTPQNYQFPATVVGDSPSTRDIHFQNLGGGTINGIKLGNLPGNYFSCSPNCSNFALGPGASTTLTLAFTPMATGTASTTVPLSNTNTKPIVPIVDTITGASVNQIYLYGIGTDKYVVSFDAAGVHTTSVADFGDVPWTTAKYMNLTITNRSKEKSGVIHPNVSASAVFSCVSGCNTVNLKPGGTQTVRIKFLPNIKGARTYTGQFNVGGTPDVQVGLTGNGVQPEFQTTEK